MNSFNTLKEVSDYLCPLGFKQYEPSPFDSEGICANFQKKILDKDGKIMYFLDAKIWDWSWTDRIKENFHIEYYVQLYKKGNHNALDIEFLDWTDEEVEKWVQKLFDNNMVENYEIEE